MPEMDYIRARSIDEVTALLRTDADAKILAGGQTLLPTIKHRLAAPSVLIDIQDLPGIAGIVVGAGEISLGAATKHAAVAASAEIRVRLPALAMLAGGIGDRQVRNMGTIAGSITNNDPAADYPAAVLALDAIIETDRRQIAADDFFLGMFTTAPETDEVVTRIRFKLPLRAGYMKFPHPASGYVMVGAFVADFGDHVRVAINGAGPCVFREPRLEALLSGGLDAAAVAALKLEFDDLNDDMHASAAFRAHLVPQITALAVRRALGEAINPFR